MLLMPPSLADWVPEDHLARFVRDVVETLDLTAIEATYTEERGYPPYHPRMMVAVLLYAYATGTYSSRKMARRLVEDVALRFLAAGNQPDFRTLSDFRKRHSAALAALFTQGLRLCRRAGLVKLGQVAIDGTRLKANASKHKAMSYGRMTEQEVALQAEIAELPGVARKAVEGTIAAAREVGADVGHLATEAAEGAIEAADRIGSAAGRAVRDAVSGTIGGVKVVVRAAMPDGSGRPAGARASAAPARPAPIKATRRPRGPRRPRRPAQATPD